MQNVDVHFTKTKLTITVDLTAATVPSASGKTQVLASTRGNQRLEVPGSGYLWLGLNCYRKGPAS